MKEEGLLPPRSSLEPPGAVHSDPSSSKLHAQPHSPICSVSGESSSAGRSTAPSPAAKGGSGELPREKKEAAAAAAAAADSAKSHALSARYVAYLGCIKDNWSSCHAAKLLDEDLITYLRPRFVLLSTPLKVRVLTSFLYIKADLIPYITSGRIDLRETDTETAFRIINFLDEQRALNPQQGPYRQKAGLEEQHMCEPHTEVESAAAVAAAASSEDPLLQLLQLPQKGVLEMTLFNARDSFDNLLKGVVHRGTQELRRAQRAVQQREKNQNESRRDAAS
ncbi:hypothetical protein, conserved [Eimeria brunetti]|uniref:Uncharacterized protein n=1 Tax=Eimeria brunetti TaxID=51314 RepID=U6LMH9_9EIME|nr:hypothetical protein, conserved [Eimeria brunetti]